MKNYLVCYNMVGYAEMEIKATSYESAEDILFSMSKDELLAECQFKRALELISIENYDD